MREFTKHERPHRRSEESSVIVTRKQQNQVPWRKHVLSGKALSYFGLFYPFIYSLYLFISLLLFFFAGKGRVQALKDVCIYIFFFSHYLSIFVSLSLSLFFFSIYFSISDFSICFSINMIYLSIYHYHYSFTSLSLLSSLFISLSILIIIIIHLSIYLLCLLSLFVLWYSVPACII